MRRVAHGRHVRNVNAKVWSRVGVYVHVIRPWVYTWMSCGTHVNESCQTHIKESRQTCEWGLSRVWMREVPHLNATYRTYERDTSQVVAIMCVNDSVVIMYVNESWLTFQCVISHVQMTHVASSRENVCEWVMTQSRQCMWMSHDSHLNASYRTWECVTRFPCVERFPCVTRWNGYSVAKTHRMP